ncbi:helix-turn-helix domain-containing protein [Williamsia muralis]|uniref:helix-turn-helix domain-containing protein n=1 Tax=Williamsia marianensis TaxID=85044 RepID=UPI003F18CCBE
MLRTRDRIALDVGRRAYAGVPCWRTAEQWLTWDVQVAYALHYDQIRPLIGAHGPSRKSDIALKTLVKIAAAHAVRADFGTGRNCRPTIELIARMTGYKPRTISRARQVLVHLGLATEILRGRQRTLAERLASHRVGDSSQGWASVYALHGVQVVDKRRGHTQAAPHLVKRPLGRNTSSHNYSLTPTGNAGKLKGHASRDRATKRRRWAGPEPDQKGLLLASRWRQDPQTPSWARRYTPAAWSHVLAKPAAHNWTGRDLNALLRDYTLTGNGNWIAANPHRPIPLLAMILNKHDDLHNRPAAIDDARETERQQHWTAVTRCSRCDYNGFVDEGDRVRRCTHQLEGRGRDSY